MKKTILLSLIVIVVGGFTSCKKNKRFEVPEDIEKIEVKVHRFDIDFLKLDTNNIDAGIKELYRRYPDFMSIYTGDILGVNPHDTAQVGDLVQVFLSDTVFKSVNEKTLAVFADESSFEQQLSAAFTNLHYYFPEMKIPEIYFFVSGFNRSLLFDNQIIGVGTDMFLGIDYPRYQSFTYQYLINNMHPQSITPSVMKGWLYNNFPYVPAEERLLENMLYRGKIMFLLSVLMPDETPDLLMGYEKNQWEWSRKYEKQIWETIIDRNDLFSSDLMLIKKYIDEAPFTATVSQESPGRLGVWLGWQIVQSYMDKHPKVTLRALMFDNNYKQIFDKSGYQP